ncbi:MAG: hypothetical protein Q9203_002349 [Teloschistes exilis]
MPALLVPITAGSLIASAAAIVAFAAGWYIAQRPVPTDRILRNPLHSSSDPSVMVIKGNNGLTFSFSSNISSDELDAHCLNIELMRQRLRGIGQYKMSSPIQGTNREYQSNFPANANETDLDEYLKIAQKMREKMAAAAHKDT